MKRAIVLGVALCGILLSSCAKTTPVAETNSQEAPTLAPTSGMYEIGTMAPVGAPTAAPTDRPSTGTAQTFTVQRGTIEDVLSFSGQIAPVQSVLSFSQDGVIGKIFVKPGQTIQEGDLVAELEMSELAIQLREARLTYDQDQQALERAVQASEVAIKQAELDLEEVRQALEELKAPASPVKIAEAQTALREAQSNLETVRNNASQVKNSSQTNLEKAVRDLQTIQKQYGETVSLLERTSGGKEKSDLSDKLKDLETQMHAAEMAVAQAQIEYDTARNNEIAAVKDAEAKLDLAQAQLDALIRGPDKFQIATQERAVRRAEMTVAKARLENTPDPSLTRAVESSRLLIEDLEKQNAGNQLFAPYGAEVTTIAAGPGTSIQSGTPVITLIDQTRTEIVVDSTTLDIGARKTPPQINTGQPVEISFSRYPGQALNGTITMAPSDLEVGNTDKNYHISFDAKDLSLDIGDLADLRASLGRKYEALWLPPAAVRFSGDRATVLVRTNDGDKQIDILTGIITNDKIEVLSGLKENDIVIGQ